MKRKSIQFRRSILAAASVLAVGSAYAGGSFAPSGSFDLNFGEGAEATLSLRDYILAITAPQQNPESVAALIQAASTGTTQQGPGGDHSVTVARNAIAAAATGNSNSSSADLALLRSGGVEEGQSGIALAASQVRGGNYYGAQTQARVEDSRIAVESYGMTPAAVAVEGNAVTASAALNQSSSTASGAVAAGYASLQSGASAVSHGVEGMNATTAGGINVATYQVAQQAGLDAGSGASVLGGGIGLSLQGGGSAQQGLSLKGNTLAADYVANSASGVIEATGGNAFQGSAIVTNAQVNGEGRYYLPLPPIVEPIPVPNPDLTFASFDSETPRATASVESSRISAELGGSYEEEGPTRLDAALAVTGNTIAATSAGNSAGARLADGTVQAGNAVIVNASTVRGGYSHAGAQLGAEGSYSDAELYADLGVLNTQANRSTTLSSRVLDSGVSVRVDRLGSQAAVAASGNRMRAAATGNLAGNLVEVRASDFGATVAAANVQSNDDTSISATQEWSQVSVDGGGSGRNVYVYGSTTLADNAITAAADGNVAATSVSVQADRVQAVDPQTGSVQAMAQAWEGTYAAARGGVTATNVQSNTGVERSIEAGVYGGIVGADLTGSSYATFETSSNNRPRLDGALVALTGNTVAAQATGNSAATGVALAGTDGLVHAAVTNAQSNDVRISASTMEAGVIAQTGPAEGSTITVQGNAIAAAATANQADNTLSSKFTSLDVSSSPYYYGGDYTGPGYYYGSGASTMAVQGIASAQRNGADVGAVNASEYGFATATVNGRRGAADSSIAVQGNQATATAAGNQVRNAVSIDAGSMAREYSMGAPIAEISSLQENDGTTHAAVSGYGHELSIGAHVQGALENANVTVTGNTAAATATANDASNKIAVAGGSLAQSERYDIGYGLTSLPSYGGADFNLANAQVAYGNEVTAQASDVRIAVERGGERNDYIGGSTVAVSGNTIAAEARANNASNALGLTGFNSLASSATVSNEQHGETRVASIVDGAQLRIRSVDSSIDGSQLAMKDNTVQSLAVGASAANSLDVQATTLQGAMPVYGPAMTLSAPTEYTPSGYAVGNNQTQWGTVAAQTEASVRMNLTDSGLEGGSATVSGNAISAVAQATSASNTLNLAGTTIGNTAGMVTSSQTTSADVSALQTAQRNVGATFVVEAGGTYGTPVTVSNNSVLASAGQNEAFNSASVSGVAVAGQFGVLNAQQGSGSVMAAAQPGLVGISAAAVYGGSLTVSGNTVAAKAAYNTAANTLAIEASAASAAAGMVRNEQTTSKGSAVANVGGYEGDGTVVGAAQGLYGYGQGTALNGSTATVSGNSVSADASGNTVANTLSVAAPATAGYGYVYGPAYQVLNSQTNQAALSANVTGSGLFMNSYGAPLQGSAVAVTGNTLAASATGNSASNVLSLGATQSGLGQGAAISNVQYNNASISATVRGAMIGTASGMVGGGSTAVTGNAISAQAVGNTAVNKLLAK